MKTKKEFSEVARLFEGWEETMIYTCLEGRMGKVISDGNNPPRAALAEVGYFCFFAGEPDEELIRRASAPALTPQDERWCRAIERVWGPRVERTLRYAVKKERDVFEPEKLRGFVGALPPEYTLKEIDGGLFERLLSEEWSRDFCALYPSYEEYKVHGLGFAALKEGVPVAGASSYTFWSEGIEIEIDTRSDCRRKGLATVCASALILECLRRGLYPSWDAHDLRSLALAEKLGYHRDKPYPVYSLKA